MKLNLFWKDKDGNKYNLGTLWKEENLYKFDIYEDELKKAIRHGCWGIGNFNFLSMHYESEELFSFFANRLPDKKYIDMEKLKKFYGLDEYDEMELLRITNAKLVTDRYWVEEVD